MRLSDVLPADIELPPGADSIQVTGITAASAAVGQGAIFAGLPGSKVDGAAYVPEALARGARAIIVGKGKSITVPEGVALLEVDNPRAVLAKIAAKFAGRQPRCAVAVTGTSGKTSVADFTRQIFTSLGYKAASLGTIGIVKPDGAVYGSLTTPDPVTLHATLAASPAAAKNANARNAVRVRTSPRLRPSRGRPQREREWDRDRSSRCCSSHRR